MVDEQKDEAVEGGAAEGSESSEGAGESTGEAAGSEDAGEEKGEPARTQPAAEKKILRDPRTGEPLRDQTVPAEDTGYLGNHNMQDKTEQNGIPEGPSEDDFGDDEK